MKDKCYQNKTCNLYGIKYNLGIIIIITIVIIFTNVGIYIHMILFTDGLKGLFVPPQPHKYSPKESEG